MLPPHHLRRLPNAGCRPTSSGGSGCAQIGASERALEAVFAAARRSAASPTSPCFVFIDEFQSLFGGRGGESSATAGITSRLLQLMDHDEGGGDIDNNRSLQLMDHDEGGGEVDKKIPAALGPRRG